MSRPLRLGAPDLNALAVLVVAVTASALAAGADSRLAWLMGAAIAVLVVLNHKTISRRLLVMSLTMAGASVMLLSVSAAPASQIAVGLKIGGIFVTLMASVSLLVEVACRSHTVQRVAQSLFPRQGAPPVQLVTLVGHLCPAFLNIGGAALLSGMARLKLSDDKGGGACRADSIYMAIHRGFSAASCWSPIFGHLALLLLVYPQLEWPDVAPFGLAMGVLFSLMSPIIGPSTPHGDESADVSAWGAVKPVLGALLPTIPLMALFLGTAIWLQQLLAVPIAVIIAGQAPFYALLWNFSVSRTLGKAWGHLIADARHALPRVAPEAIFFAAGGCMMALLSAAIPQVFLESASAAVGGLTVLGIALILGLSIGLALVGLHPVLTALLLAASLSPEQLNLSPLVHFLTVLLGCAIAFTISPYTVLCLLIARDSARSPFEIAYRWNATFAAAMSLIGGALLWSLERIH